MCETLAKDERTARKAHVCIWCGEDIEVGTRYLDVRGTNDETGTVDTNRWHLECETALQEAIREEGQRGCYYFGAYEHKRGSCEEG